MDPSRSFARVAAAVLAALSILVCLVPFPVTLALSSDDQLTVRCSPAALSAWSSRLPSAGGRQPDLAMRVYTSGPQDWCGGSARARLMLSWILLFGAAAATLVARRGVPRPRPALLRA